MVRPLGLPFDPIERAGQTWEKRFGPASAMRAATSVFRVQQILLARFDEVLKPHELTFARYEVLVLLTFSRTGELPLKVIGSRLMVHPTCVTNAIDRLVVAGYVDRRPNPADGRGVLAGITATAGAWSRRRRGADRRWTSASPTWGRASWRPSSTCCAGPRSVRVTWPAPRTDTTLTGSMRAMTGSRHHAIDYVELTVTDLAAAKRFYAEAFGWGFTDYGPAYAGIRGRRGGAGGRWPAARRAAAPAGRPAGAALLRRPRPDPRAVEAAGGRVTEGPYAFPGGRRFHFADPSGNELGVWAER